MGDFNVDLSLNNSNSKEWLDFTSNFQLIQLIKAPTRVTATTATLIDHFFTSHLDKARAVKVAKIGLSDHYPICANIILFVNLLYCCSILLFVARKDIFGKNVLPLN